MTLTCRDVALVLAQTSTPALSYPADVAQHLSRCPKCVTFERQLLVLGDAIAQVCREFEEELPADFEARLVQRLCSSPR
jgi:hypothetical protein